MQESKLEIKIKHAYQSIKAIASAKGSAQVPYRLWEDLEGFGKLGQIKRTIGKSNSFIWTFKLWALFVDNYQR